MLWLVFGVVITLNTLKADDTNATLLFDGGINALLVDKKAFTVTASDEVTGGCLPKIGKIKETMEQSLKNNGFEIVDDPSALTPEIRIVALGFMNNGSCSVTLLTNLNFYIAAKVPAAANLPGANETILNYSYPIEMQIVNSPRSRMQAMLIEATKENANKVYMAISRAKDIIFEKFPQIREEIKNSSK